MNNWKVIFATVVIFGAGVVTGGLLVSSVDHSRPRNYPRRPAAMAEVHPSVTNPSPRQADAARPPRLPEVLSKQFLQQLDEQLHLAADQHEAIQKIIGDGQNQMRKTVQDARLEIREQLTPEQRQQFDELVKRPFRKPISDTNAPVGAESDFKSRLEKIVAAQRANGGETVPAPPNFPLPPPSAPTHAP